MSNRLPWRRYLWCARSDVEGGVEVIQLVGVMHVDNASDITIRSRALGAAATFARDSKIPWNPFNVALLVKPAPVQAQIVPEQDQFLSEQDFKTFLETMFDNDLDL